MLAGVLLLLKRSAMQGRETTIDTQSVQRPHPHNNIPQRERKEREK